MWSTGEGNGKPLQYSCLDNPMNSMKRQTDGENVETASDFIFLYTFKINADGDCSYKIKRCLLFGRKAMTNLDSVLKSRDITLQTNGPTKVHVVKTWIFP